MANAVADVTNPQTWPKGYVVDYGDQGYDVLCEVCALSHPDQGALVPTPTPPADRCTSCGRGFPSNLDEV
jgi:hypothetical protein